MGFQGGEIMYCSNCGKELKDGEVCACQQPVQPQAPQQNSQQPNQGFQPQAPDNSKLFCILSYIGILWLIGLLINPEKSMPKVRFHVGQGIILSIVQAGLGIIAGILNAIIGAVFSQSVLGYSLGVSGFGLFLMGLISFLVAAVCITFMVLGIVNVARGKDQYLPIIGRFAFYK